VKIEEKKIKWKEKVKREKKSLKKEM